MHSHGICVNPKFKFTHVQLESELTLIKTDYDFLDKCGVDYSFGDFGEDSRSDYDYKIDMKN